MLGIVRIQCMHMYQYTFVYKQFANVFEDYRGHDRLAYLQRFYLYHN